ncbi:uncharacterized protein A1O5_01770, partial [Cladophialophora psammophila CBS 110553]
AAQDVSHCISKMCVDVDAELSSHTPGFPALNVSVYVTYVHSFRCRLRFGRHPEYLDTCALRKPETVYCYLRGTSPDWA